MVHLPWMDCWHHGPVPRGGCRTSTAPMESSWQLQRVPSAAQLHNTRAWEGSRIKNAFGLIFGCLNEHRCHHSVASSLTTLSLVHLWALRIGSDITELSTDLPWEPGLPKFINTPYSQCPSLYIHVHMDTHIFNGHTAPSKTQLRLTPVLPSFCISVSTSRTRNSPNYKQTT